MPGVMHTHQSGADARCGAIELDGGLGVVFDAGHERQHVLRALFAQMPLEQRMTGHDVHFKLIGRLQSRGDISLTGRLAETRECFGHHLVERNGNQSKMMPGRIFTLYRLRGFFCQTKHGG